MNHETGAQCTVSEEVREGELLLLQRLQAQLEELFSDSHLAEDGFLLKHIQKNKEGFVNLKLLTCLKKIKVLTENWYMTLAAALLSDLLVVSDESNKVRRRQPCPDWLLCSPTSRLLLVWNLPEDQRTQLRGTSQNLKNPTLSDQLRKKFSSYGNIRSFWLLPPGKELPKELQCYAKRQKELGQCLCAVVKFDSLDAVRKAYSELKAEEEASAGKGIRVVSLGFRSAHLIAKEQPFTEENQDEAEVSREEVVPGPTETSESVGKAQTSLTQEVQVVDTSVKPETETETELELEQKPELEPEPPLHSGDCAQVPWVLRRRLALLNAEMCKNKVLRLPYGPDGTKGFHYKRTTTTAEVFGKATPQ